MLRVGTLDLDVLGSVDPGLGYDDLIVSTDTLEVCGHEIRVLSLERLIELKRGMTRPKDKLMLIHLEATLEEREGLRKKD